MRERDLLRHIYERSADLTEAAGILTGPGDDCAVIRSPDAPLLLTVDQLVGRRHFDPDTTPLDLIARKVVARSISDIAAMGGTPSCALATGCLPDSFEDADELFDRMAAWARHFHCPLVGGDIAATDGPLVLTCASIGIAHASRGPVLRSQAQPGDTVCVTGRLGGSLETGHHLHFEPRVAEAAALCGTLADRLGAMIDLSDGLGIDASRVAEASRVRIEIDAAQIPLNDSIQDWRQAASDGEDYELLFTVCGDADLAGVALPSATPITEIGRVVKGEGCVIIDTNRQTHDAAQLGWDHGT